MFKEGNYRITVIMGIYNCASTLVEALDSLYTQTYKNFKIILCDDGSTDNTYQIAYEYSKRKSNIILIQNNKNQGLNYTLNYCLKYADTEYCARMDGDDISLPKRFEKEIDFLDKHPEYAIVSCPMIYFDENGEFKRGHKNGEPKISDLIDGPPFCHAPCMIRRTAYEAVGGYTINKYLIRYEDYNLWMKMYAAGFKGYNLNECLYAMRDDSKAAQRRTLKSSINGIYAHYLAYRTLRLSTFRFIRYCCFAIVRGILPSWIYIRIHKT
jgi:glycosyltransferase EpsE